MSYGTFSSVAHVAETFDIEVTKRAFLQRKEIPISNHYFSDITAELADEASFINEATICEAIIRPILRLIVIQYRPLYLWSHIPYNVDKEKGLVGEPDYLIAPRTKYGGIGVPPLCVIEAKKDDFDDGWTQALAEMVAASIQGEETCYAVVTTGKIWEFGKLEKRLFTKNTGHVSALIDLQAVFDSLNWLFEIMTSTPTEIADTE